ncbi:MAG: response regulator [Bacteroidota bacterium]
METQKANLFLVDDDHLMVSSLKKFLEVRFGDSFNISTFYDGDSCIKNIDSKTKIVILDYFMEGKNGLETLKLIKAANPKTEVIMLSSNEDLAVALETFRVGAKDYVVKGTGSWQKIKIAVEYIITEPIRILVREFGISKYMAIFLLTFTSVGIVVLIALFALTK